MKRITSTRKNRWLKSVAAAFFMVTGLGVHAQTTYQIGTGTTTSSSNPIAPYYGYSYSQQIYLQSDMVSEGATMGTISTIRFYFQSGSLTNSTNWTVYMGNTSKSVFDGGSDWVPVSEMAQVFSGTITSPGAGNWVDVVLSTPFNWNGADNLVIAVDENEDGYTSNSSWGATSVGSNRGLYFRSDGVNTDPASPDAGTRVSTIPNLQFDLTPAPDCTTPAAQTISVTGTPCIGGNILLQGDTDEFYAGQGLQWQFLDNGTWTDIDGATDLAYAVEGIQETTSYRLVSACELSMEESISNELEIIVNPLPEITLNAASYTFCSGESAVMTASGGDTYSWEPSTALTATTGDMVGASPSTATSYTVTGTDANGCENTATAIVMPLSEVVVSASVSPAENCTANDPVTFEVSGTPESVSGMGQWEYRWLEEDGETVALDWTTSNQYIFVPNQDGVYTFYYQLRSSSCPSDYIDSVAVSAIIGFGTESSDLVHVDCNVPEGSISLINAFGQSGMQEFYANDFEVDAGENTVLYGNASITDGRMVITSSATSLKGAFAVENPGVALSGDLSVSFNLTADLPINNYNTGGADGITYSFADNADYSTYQNVVNGRGNKLRVCFDAAPNGTENGNEPGIYVVYGWNGTNAFGPASSEVLAYSDNISLWKNRTDVPVEVTVSQFGQLTLTVDGVTVFNSVQLPVEYAQADKSSWRHFFSAATGGDALRHAIDNLNIMYGTYSFGITAENGGTPSEWQASSIFTELTPGRYDVWMSNPDDAVCSRKIGTYEILNNYPVVDFGNDTTICEGETLLLDAGNAGSTYTWSNTNEHSQTIEVAEAGNYICYVTNPDGCLGIGSIQVDIAGTPQAAGIQVQGGGLNQLFAVVNPQNTTSYSWDFGDGTTIANGASVQSHTYGEDGNYTITVTLENEFGCTETVITENITVENGTASIASNETDSSISLYPNPAADFVTVLSGDMNIEQIEIYTVSGQLVMSSVVDAKTVQVATSNWQGGVYYVKVITNGKMTVQKLVVQ